MPNNVSLNVSSLSLVALSRKRWVLLPLLTLLGLAGCQSASVSTSSPNGVMNNSIPISKSVPKPKSQNESSPEVDNKTTNSGYHQYDYQQNAGESGHVTEGYARSDIQKGHSHPSDDIHEVIVDVIEPSDSSNTKMNIPLPDDDADKESSPVFSLPDQSDEKVRQALLEKARHNSRHAQSMSTKVSDDNDSLPAFKQLMNAGIVALQKNQPDDAEDYFTRAQRIAPQSASVYFYLGQVALKKHQPIKAEAMARRGLLVVKSQDRKKALWQLILYAGKMQSNQRIINEAQSALNTFF